MPSKASRMKTKPAAAQGANTIVDLPLGEQIGALRDNAMGFFNLASAHAQMSVTMLRWDPESAALPHAVNAAVSAMRNALGAYEALMQTHREANQIVADRLRAEHRGEVQ